MTIGNWTLHLNMPTHSYKNVCIFFTHTCSYLTVNLLSLLLILVQYKSFKETTDFKRCHIKIINLFQQRFNGYGVDCISISWKYCQRCCYLELSYCKYCIYPHPVNLKSTICQSNKMVLTKSPKVTFCEQSTSWEGVDDADPCLQSI